MVESGSWLYDGNYVPFDQVIKKDGYWFIRFKYVQPGSSNKHFYCAVCKITDKEQKSKRNIGVKSIGNDMIDLHHVIKGSHRDCPLFMLKNNYGIIYLYL